MVESIQNLKTREAIPNHIGPTRCGATGGGRGESFHHSGAILQNASQHLVWRNPSTSILMASFLPRSYIRALASYPSLVFATMVPLYSNPKNEGVEPRPIPHVHACYCRR